MGAAVLLRNVVGEAEHGFLVGIGPLHRDVDRGALMRDTEVDDLAMQRCLQQGQMLDERADTALVLEDIVPAAALVEQLDLDARIQERQLAQALGEDVVVELDRRKRRQARMEAHRGAALCRGTDQLERVQRLAERVFLAVLEAIAANRQPEVIRQRIDHRHADAMQAARNLVAVVVELAAGVQHGHDDLGRRTPFFFLDADRDAAAVVGASPRHVVGIRLSMLNAAAVTSRRGVGLPLQTQLGLLALERRQQVCP